MADVHTTDAETGGCLERCAHPDHHGPKLYAVPSNLERLLEEWAESLGATVMVVPTFPDDDPPFFKRALVTPDTASPVAGRVAPARYPRARTR